MLTTRARIDRHVAIEWYRKNRARTRALFDLLTEDAYYAQPIALRHPIVFYEGHLPAFSLNTLVKKALGRPGIDETLERLFARGIDPDHEQVAGRPFTWPERTQVRAFADAADASVLDVLAHADLDVPGHALLDGAEAVYTILEHEAMHQETLLYMWQRLPLHQKRAPADYAIVNERTTTSNAPLPVPAGTAVLGARRAEIPFGWDNEFEALSVDVEAFTIDQHSVTNGEFLEFIAAGGYSRGELWASDDWKWIREHDIRHPAFWESADGDGWYWRGMFEQIRLPFDWPVYVSQAEACAYARWRQRRLPTEAEYQRAAYGSPDDERRFYPWGDEPPDATRGVFDFASWEPQPVGTHPAGRSAWGVDDLVGNGWEWTSSVFRPFPGFAPMASYPEYSADFFDESHYVMKGASPATARELLRPSFRNWFRSRYPYVYAKFRLAGMGGE